METQTLSEDIRRYIALLWHWAWLLVASTLLAGVVAYAVSKQIAPTYKSTTTILVNEAPSTRSADYTAILASERLADTYAAMMVKLPVLQGVIERLDANSSLTPEQIRGKIQITPLNNTQLINVSVTDTDAERAAAIANALVLEFAEQNLSYQTSRFSASKQSLEEQLALVSLQITQTENALEILGDPPSNKAEKARLETIQTQNRQTYAYLLQSYETVRLAEANSISGTVQVEQAQPGVQVGPQVMRNTGLAMVVGLMLAVGVIFLIEALDDTIRSPADVEKALDLPILAMIAKYSSAVEDDGPITTTQPRTPVAEAFRSLRTNIQFASVDKPITTMLVTSPSPSDGKSTVAVNLAIVLAQSGRRVTLADADLRRPRVHKLVKVPNRRGFSDLFVQSPIELDGVLQETPFPNFYALPSGSLPPNPSELLGSEKMSEILDAVRERTDMVILDTPPVLAVTDACVLAQRVDGVLLVIKPGVTKLAAARQAVELLRRVGANILGVVLNEVKIGRSRYYYYHYQGYSYAYYGGDYEAYSNDGTKKRRKHRRSKHAEREPESVEQQSV